MSERMSRCIEHLYPKARAGEHYLLRATQEGSVIEYWNDSLGPRPTTAALDAAWLPALKARKIAEIRAGVVRDCEAIMPVWEFIYVTRARLTDSRVSQLETIAKRGRDLEAYVNDARRTEQEVEAVLW